MPECAARLRRLRGLIRDGGVGTKFTRIEKRELLVERTRCNGRRKKNKLMSKLKMCRREKRCRIEAVKRGFLGGIRKDAGATLENH